MKTDRDVPSELPMGETHTLPCGHTLSTRELLARVGEFSRPSRRGSGRCPHCNAPFAVELSSVSMSDGATEWFETFVTVGDGSSGPGEDFQRHHRIRVRGLDINGRLAQLGSTEWRLPGPNEPHAVAEERPNSRIPRYATGEEVRLGDHVRLKRLLRRPLDGIVDYVYDVTKPSPPWGNNDAGFSVRFTGDRSSTGLFPIVPDPKLELIRRG